jgi:hypothetical protein
MIKMKSQALKQKSYIILVTNIYKKHLIHNDIQYIIRQTMPISKTQSLTPF